jgi:hypothetical protein
MGHQSDQKLLGLRAPRIRRAFMMFLAFAYLFVGLVHATEHASENLPATFSAGISVAATDGSDGDSSEKPSAVAEHCHIYATALMPVLAPVATRSDRSLGLSFVTPKLLLEDHPWLDTPPPKQLT